MYPSKIYPQGEDSNRNISNGPFAQRRYWREPMSDKSGPPHLQLRRESLRT
jgi:hypothetical protein